MTVSDLWARFWAVDLHVHTPGSEDAAHEDFGEPAEIVRAALDARLDCIAVTDHNTAEWCDRVATAAAGTSLIVLPGVELSTSEGHLLGIWEEGTSSGVIEDVLTELGINRTQRGKLDVVANAGIVQSAVRINASGGVAIAAHIDRERGILKLPVQTHVNALLASEELSALEFVQHDTIAKVIEKLKPSRLPAMVQGSDCWSVEDSRHALSGIGRRRTWIKAGRADLCGLLHALDDPTLRVTLSDPAETESHPTVTRVTISSGFLAGLSLDLSPDLNCLLGGTGAGKSLVLETIRFALDQQVDGSVFRQVREEVDLRLRFALEEGTEVSVQVESGTERYRFNRVYSADAGTATSYQWAGDDWVEVDIKPIDIIAIAAFSQGEILEYARQPVGRVGLIDAHLDLVGLEEQIRTAEVELAENSKRLIRAKGLARSLLQEAGKAPELSDQVRKLAEVFDSDSVKQQGNWTKELGALNTVRDDLEAIIIPNLPVPATPAAVLVPDHTGYFDDVGKVLETLSVESSLAIEQLNASLTKAKASIEAVRTSWQSDFTTFKVELDRQLAAVPGNSSLPALRLQLEGLQTKLDSAEAASKRLSEVAHPELTRCLENREKSLQKLADARKARRVQRRDRVSELNRKMAGFVRLDIPRDGDTSRFREALNTIKVGSRVRDEVLDAIAKRIHPYRFVRALWSGDVNSLVDADAGINATDIGRILANVDDRDLWTVLLATQTIDNPDVLNVSFRKPDDGSYAPIESLSHGQKCTAILVILMADGDNPVLVDQPEDALHAPWIEEYLVDRLRELRGTRQYIFATRSPGLVVSADAEQIVTMKATAGRGECEASGSLERHDLNELALHHLEGGKTPFGRRARKLRFSISG